MDIITLASDSSVLNQNEPTPTDDSNAEDTIPVLNDSSSVPPKNTADTAANVDHTHNTRSKTGVRPHQYDKVYGADYTFAIALTQMSTEYKCLKLYRGRINWYE